MTEHDPTEPQSLPRDVRLAALSAAEAAFDRVVREAGYHLDFFARLEALEDALNDAYEKLQPKLN